MRRLVLCLATLGCTLVLAAAGAAATHGEFGPNDFRISEAGPFGDATWSATGPEVAYNSTANEYLVVWTGGNPTTGGDYQVWGQRIDAATGAQIVSDFQISSNATDASQNFFALTPHVAYNSVLNEYLVVWANDDQTVNGDQEIYAQRLSAAGAEVGTNDFLVSQTGATSSNGGPLHPDVAYDPTHDDYLVIWVSDVSGGVGSFGESRVYGQRLEGTGTAFGTNDFPISQVPNGIQFSVAEAALTFNATAGEYLVVWQASARTSDSEWELYGQRLDAATGLQVGVDDFRFTDVGPTGNTNYGANEPDVAWSSASNEYLVVWYGEGDAPLVDDEWEVFGQRLSATGLEVGADDFRISSMGTDASATFDGQAPAVAYDALSNEYFVVWEGDDVTNDEFEIYGQRINAATGSEVGNDDFRLSDMGADGSTAFNGFTPSVASRGGTTQNLIAWWGNDDGVPGLGANEFEIFGQLYDTAAPTLAQRTTLVAERSRAGVLLRWRTTGPGDVVAFDVRRDGVRVNRRAIPSNPVAGPASYRYLDRGAVRGRTHGYAVVAIRADGTRQVVARASA